jgi:hypothetical protein
MGRVRPNVVGVAPPGLEDNAGLGERGERLEFAFSSAGARHPCQPNSTFPTGNLSAGTATGDRKRAAPFSWLQVYLVIY